MGIKFGELDVNQILENEFRIGVLERLIDWLISRNATLTGPSAADLASMRRETVEDLKRKYPNSGISYKEG